MTIRISLSREPVTEALPGFPGVSLTVRRLTTPDLARIQNAVQGLLKDRTALAVILLRHELVKTAADLKRAQSDPAFQAGFAAWLTAVECGLYGILDWEGVTGDDGKAPLVGEKGLALIAGAAEPPDLEAPGAQAALTARITMETLMLDPAFEAQATGLLNRSARLLALEGNGSGSSVNGSAAAAPKTPGGPNTADGAQRRRKAAPGAAATA